jgi:hypothetical protein
MNYDEARTIIKEISEHKKLNKIQEIILKECWQGHSYSEIASSHGYDIGYVKDVGSKLWQYLSIKLNEKVSKNNFALILKQYKSSLDRQQTLKVSIHTSRSTTMNHFFKEKYQNWGEKMDVSLFWGRTEELTILDKWIVDRGSRLVVISGMGGIGKTALAMKLARQIQPQFKYLVWRSLRNKPLFTDLIAEITYFLAKEQKDNLSENIDTQISQLMEYLRSSRCLLILDNFESILQNSQKAVNYQQGYENYGQLLRRIAEENHQSCLILTSREMPIAIANRKEKNSLIRSLQLTGLQVEESQKILQAKDLKGTRDEFQQLINLYTGNPLALKIAATAIEPWFDRNIGLFLKEKIVVFGEIWDLLNRQFERLSVAEQKIAYYLATNAKSTTLTELKQEISDKISHRELIEILLSLQARSLIEKESTNFSLQPLFMEYVKEKLLSDRKKILNCADRKI